MAKNKLKKGDTIKVIGSAFKGFYGSYVRFIPEGTTSKNFDIDRIKISMYGKNTTINLPVGYIKKVIPKCNCCEKDLELTWREIGRLVSDSKECDECLKKRKSGKYFHFDKMKWLREKPKEWKELDRRAKLYELSKQKLPSD